ncbi:dCMP deaminase [Chryseobacterium shandongense]|nr:dCMP deaminase [Chryseobacterium shandongense]
MQIAFNAKYNSGCISRQVGAVVTDKSYSIKGVGWNEVPEGQTPCSLRSIYEFKNGFSNPSVFTDFEKNGRYDDDEKSFKDKIVESINSVPVDFKDELNGRNCPYCFKEFHNSFEGQKNQVHTRSLHAEENAMLQITKYGGQPLKGGHLFTTASPCELCSKKAYQLGIQNIFYIDPYPGISRKQILKGGNSEMSNPNLYMYQGVVGRGFNKLYEPFMSIKDETKLRTKIRPVENNKVKIKTLKKIFEKEMKSDIVMKNKLDELFEDDKEVIRKLTDIIKKGLDNNSVHDEK